ncbi:metallophosphoesterase [Candidatus Methylospira mobilis]|uniref:Metallophosphoesterase n=1 Tax=Candidatus Methylospira mobilis TaxID=1808979 RepID=A0A5Q0BIH5_9GAMM|nr:metallophosphoesterase [Candidatus Methylospira mobilis]QFY41954.1 metallophosphoesterase [Candidatus Methylospira mobilis]WNV02944.1 metallophosphoesterase [Candidatus Methylospira mobilis]
MHMHRLLIVLGILASLNVYVAFRIISRTDWLIRHRFCAWLMATGFFALQLTAPLGDSALFPALKKQIAMEAPFTVINWLSYSALGIFSCLSVYMIAADCMGAVWKRIPRAQSLPFNFERRALLTLGAAALGTGVTGIGQAVSGPRVRAVNIPLSGLPAGFDGFRIAQISDLHVGPTIGRDYTENVVRMVNALKPDLIVLTGDFVDGSVRELKDDVAPLRELEAPHGTFFVTGNHEYYSGAAEWIDEFTTLGARVLSNEHVLIRRNNEEIVLAGVTDYSTLHMQTPDASNPKKALEGAPHSRVKVLLAHQPVSYRMAQAAGFDLQLSGHTHAGQYFPFSLFIRLFQRYYKGLNRYENMWVYVNSGTGYWGPPLRAGVPSEITLIQLKQEA